MQSYLYGVIRKKLFSISDISDYWKTSEFSRRCRTYNLVTGPDPLPLSYERFVGAKAVKLCSYFTCTPSILHLVQKITFWITFDFNFPGVLQTGCILEFEQIAN